MGKELKIPTSEHFRKNVEYMEENYGIVDCIYTQCIEELSNIKLKEIKRKHETRIIRAFLLDWGKMQRWLGEKGLEKVYEKLQEKSLISKLEPFRDKNLKLINLEKVRSQIIGLFDEIARTPFKTEKGKPKNLNSTTASKVLHLCCPDMFIMWDADIRYSYGKGRGEDYFQFLVDMKKLWKSLGKTIQGLQKQYSKKATRIIDKFNWREYHKKSMR